MLTRSTQIPNNFTAAASIQPQRFIQHSPTFSGIPYDSTALRFGRLKAHEALTPPDFDNDIFAVGNGDIYHPATMIVPADTGKRRLDITV